VGRIHWAATETAERWPGYMDGAVRAGEAAADAVLGHLAAAVTGG
jgi:monoamine oxidase